MHNVEYDAALIDVESPISAAVTPRGLSSRERQLIIVGGRAAKFAMQAQVVATIGRHEIWKTHGPPCRGTARTLLRSLEHLPVFCRDIESWFAASCASRAGGGHSSVFATIGRHEIFSSGSSKVNLKLPTSFQIVGSVRS